MAASSLSDYPHLKSEIENTGKAILQIAQQTNNTAIADFLEEVLDKLPKEEFYLALLGLFKRGKSTLINALLGKIIVPTGVIPVTSVITRIRYGNDPTARISFGDGSYKEVTIQKLPEYVTEAGNPNNAKKVTVADVLLPSQILKDGLILIDTPGVGSTYLNGTRITFQFLDRADFAVFVLAVDPPVGQQELELLTNLASKSNKILFVLNKVDYVDSASLNESVKYCQKVISEHLGRNHGSKVVVYPMSAKLALEGRLYNDPNLIERSGIEKFETALKESLINGKESLILNSARKKLGKSASDLTNYLQLEIKSSTMPLEKLTNLLSEFECYLDSVEHRKRELFYVLGGRVKEIVSMLDEDLAVFKKEHEEVMTKQVEDFAEEKFKSEKISSRKIVSDTEDFLKKTLIETYSEFIEHEDFKVENKFQQLVNDSEVKMDALIGDVRQKAAQLFGFKVTEATFNASLIFETKFYYHIDPIFTAGMTIRGGEMAQLLPKTLFRGILTKRIREKTRTEFDKNGGRIRYDYFITRLDQAVVKLKKDINRDLESSTETVKQAVHEAARLRTESELQMKSNVNELKLMVAHLQAINEQLRREFEFL